KLSASECHPCMQGTNTCVHGVGSARSATAIESPSVDYRYAAGDGNDVALRSTILPPDVEDRCRELTRRLGLAFSGIDLKRTPDGEWFCFKVNTSPGYSYYQEQSGQPIADALVRYLAGSDRDCAVALDGADDGAGY